MLHKSLSIWNFQNNILQPLERALFFKNFEKMQATSLYWFAAQQQTSTFRRPEFSLFYLTFSAEFNGLSFKF